METSRVGFGHDEAFGSLSGLTVEVDAVTALCHVKRVLIGDHVTAVPGDVSPSHLRAGLTPKHSPVVGIQPKQNPVTLYIKPASNGERRWIPRATIRHRSRPGSPHHLTPISPLTNSSSLQEVFCALPYW